MVERAEARTREQPAQLALALGERAQLGDAAETSATVKQQGAELRALRSRRPRAEGVRRLASLDELAQMLYKGVKGDAIGEAASRRRRGGEDTRLPQLIAHERRLPTARERIGVRLDAAHVVAVPRLERGAQRGELCEELPGDGARVAATLGDSSATSDTHTHSRIALAQQRGHQRVRRLGEQIEELLFGAVIILGAEAVHLVAHLSREVCEHKGAREGVLLRLLGARKRRSARTRRSRWRRQRRLGRGRHAAGARATATACRLVLREAQVRVVAQGE